MIEPEPGWTEQLHAYGSLFGDVFRRREQARWATVYLQALLTADGRKTINQLARCVVLPPDLTVEDASQALQNFVNQSPWDEQAVWRRYRTLMAERLAEPDGVFVVDDLTFVKQGRHSVGVHRQYSSALGRKTNCQVAVALHYVSAAGSCPLGLRLYLPRAWLQQPERLNAAGVPQQNRSGASKTAIMLDLLDEARQDGWPARPVLGGAVFGADRDFRENLNARGLPYLLEAPANLLLTEGETFKATEKDRGWVGNGIDDAEAMARQARQTLQAAGELESVLTGRLGLDHFEGRSWRGFHHHACLVTLAFGFRFFSDFHEDYASTEAAAVGV